MANPSEVESAILSVVKVVLSATSLNATQQSEVVNALSSVMTLIVGLI